jgi:hypothetical protein
VAFAVIITAVVATAVVLFVLGELIVAICVATAAAAFVLGAYLSVHLRRGRSPDDPSA